MLQGGKALEGARKKNLLGTATTVDIIQKRGGEKQRGKGQILICNQDFKKTVVTSDAASRGRKKYNQGGIILETEWTWSK